MHNIIKPISNALSQIFLNYRQIVQLPTHLAGATLDHVYLRTDFVGQYNVQDFVNCMYFSDHDAIQFTLSHKTD